MLVETTWCSLSLAKERRGSTAHGKLTPAYNPLLFMNLTIQTHRGVTHRLYAQPKNTLELSPLLLYSRKSLNTVHKYTVNKLMLCVKCNSD